MKYPLNQLECDSVYDILILLAGADDDYYHRESFTLAMSKPSDAPSAEHRVKTMLCENTKFIVDNPAMPSSRPWRIRAPQELRTVDIDMKVADINLRLQLLYDEYIVRIQRDYQLDKFMRPVR